MNKFIFLMLCTLPASAGVYKWTDSDGNIHFGDRPTSEQSATEVKIKINNNSGVTNSSGRKADRDYLLKKIDEGNVANAEKKKKQKSENKKRQRLCNSYKRDYQVHQQSNRTYSMTPDGERTYLSDGERAVRGRKLAKGVSKNCR